MAEAVAGARRFSLRKVPGAVWGLGALALGMLLGTLWGDLFLLQWIGKGIGYVFQALKLGAPYIIFFTIGAAIVDMLRHGKAGRFSLWVTIVFTGIGLAAGPSRSSSPSRSSGSPGARATRASARS